MHIAYLTGKPLYVYHVGFTATQKGLNTKQLQTLRNIVNYGLKNVDNWHHGDCIGGDDQLDTICCEAGKSIIVHPPEDSSKRAFVHMKCTGQRTILEPDCYLNRNKCIVDSSQVLVACPYEDIQQLRSGTWSTVRFARKRNVPVLLIPPSDGMIRFL